MLEIKNLVKIYEVNENRIYALNDISLSFRESEFVCVQGKSGCGKSTLLNMIGALDMPSSGEIIIDGISTKDYTSKDFDSYRNNNVGFVFQSYNLIENLTIYENVELALTINGLEKKQRKKHVNEALESVGMKDIAYKKPTQLSGGQMQRVAIARAIVNKPKVILADEPTGALDSITSKQVIDVLKEVSKNTLVIMVTHDEELAQKYADRIIKIVDGKITNDTKPYKKSNNKESILKKPKSVKLSINQAFLLSYRNLASKKSRTLITAIAYSIAILAIALILSISNGVNKYINRQEKAALSTMPITIRQFYIDFSKIANSNLSKSKLEKFPNSEKILPLDGASNIPISKNILTDEYIEYIKKMDKSYYSSLQFVKGEKINLFNQKTFDRYNTDLLVMETPSMPGLGSLQMAQWSQSWQMLSADKEKMGDNFTLLKGKYPTNKNEVIIMLDIYNRISSKILDQLSIAKNKDGEYTFENILNTKLSLISNNDLYKRQADNTFSLNNSKKDIEDIIKNGKAEDIRIVGIIRPKNLNSITNLSPGLIYTKELTEYNSLNSSKSDVVIEQKNSMFDIVDDGIGGEYLGVTLNEKEKNKQLESLGGISTLYHIDIYPSNLKTREKLINYLDQYNEKYSSKVKYIDITSLFIKALNGFMTAANIGILAFSSVSLLVASIMISIITYVSVLERSREIGLLRAIGASKYSVSLIFNVESLLLGILSAIIAIISAYIILIPANIIIKNISTAITTNILILNPLHAFVLFVLSLILSLLSGIIPAIIASRKQPMDALRS